MVRRMCILSYSMLGGCVSVLTWLCSDIPDNELAVEGYRLDRNRHGDGVAVITSICKSCYVALWNLS